MPMRSEFRAATGTEPFGITRGEDSVLDSFSRCYRQGQNRRPTSLGWISFLCLAAMLASPVATNTDAEASLTKVLPKAHKVTVTAYTNIARCTDTTPNETASLLKLRPKHYWKVIALSRDLAKHYRFGDRFQLVTGGEIHFVEFQDLMADKHKNRIDLLLPSAKKCKRFGKRDGILIPLEEPNRLADPSHDTQAWKRKT